MRATVIRLSACLIVASVSLAVTSPAADRSGTSSTATFAESADLPAPTCRSSDVTCATFAWTVADRFMSVWTSWGSAGNAGNYSRTVVREPFVLRLDACGSTGGATAIASYDWTLLGGVGTRVVEHRLSETCRTHVPVPAEGTYYVLLTIRAHDGATASAMRRVEFTDLLIVSLGDSYASGEGNPDIQRGTTTPVGEWQDRRCHRSRLSGPAQTAQELERRDTRSTVTFLSYACSGATIRQGLIGEYLGQVPVWPPMVPQVTAAARVLCSDDVCERAEDPVIDVLHISIGGNDVGFGVAIIACAARLDDLANRTFRSLIGIDLIPYRDCNRQPRLAQYLEDRFEELPRLYRDLQQEIRLRLKVRTVVVTEYPADLFDSGAGCGSLELVTAAEAQWLAAYGRRLNEIIRAAWGQAVTEIAPAFAGHGYCATPTFYGSLGQSLSRQLDYLGVLHPNADGHRIYRDALLRTLQSPGTTMK